METSWGGNLRLLFEDAGAIYNEQTGLYELNGITDLTLKEMVYIYQWHRNNCSSDFNNRFFYANCRTLFPLPDIIASNQDWKATYMNTACEVIKITRGNRYLTVFRTDDMFRDCRKLKQINTEISFFANKANLGTTRMFSNCLVLEDVKLKGLMTDISFAESPLLSNDTILYMVQNSNATTTITVTLHPEAYERAIADAEIMAAVEAKQYVSLATGA